MTTDDKIKDENLQYDVNKEAAKMSPLLSGKVNKYEFLAGEEILQFCQSRTIERAKFTEPPLPKAFEKKNWRPKNEISWNFKSFKARRKTKTRIN